MIIVLSTYPDKESAEKTALLLVEKELAACVSIVKIEESFYRWRGKVERHGEYLLLIKSTKKAYPQIEAYITHKHPHKVPEVVYIEVSGGAKNYLEWLEANTLSKLLRVPLDFSAMKRVSEPSSSAKNPRTSSR